MEMIDQDRFVHIVFQIDTNRINARNSLPSMNQIQTWHEAGVILIHMSQVANEEAKAGGDARRSMKATSAHLLYDVRRHCGRTGEDASNRVGSVPERRWLEERT